MALYQDEYGYGDPWQDRQPADQLTDPLAPQSADLTAMPQPAAPQPTDPYARVAFQQAWQANPGHSAADLKALIASDPRYAGITQGGANGDIVNLPGYTEAETGIYRGPESLDVIGDVGGGNRWAWSGLGGGQGGQSGGGGGQGSPGALGGPGGAAGNLGGGAAVDPQMRDYLLRLMARSEPSNINPLTDPNLAPQANAYSAARQRGAERERSALAERAAASGLNQGGAGSGAFEQGISNLTERAGQDIAGQQAGLVGQEVAARRSDLLNGLQIANSVGARDQAAQIQRELANLDNQYRYAALGQNQSQFNDQYGLNRAQFEYGANRDALLGLLQGGGF